MTQIEETITNLINDVQPKSGERRQKEFNRFMNFIHCMEYKICKQEPLVFSVDDYNYFLRGDRELKDHVNY